MIIDAKTKKEKLLCRNALSLKNALATVNEDNFDEIEIIVVNSYVLNDPMES
jgi:hypothetical protein